MSKPTIVTLLSKDFNASAPDIRYTLEKYNARLNLMFQDASGSSYYSVTGVPVADAKAFMQEFRILKGVEAAYEKPPEARM